MGTTTNTTTVVLSFSGVLRALYSGRITAEDLEGALFYFGCTRGHFLDNGVGGTQGEMQHDHAHDPSGVEAVYRVIREAVLAAEEAGRVAWRHLIENPNWEQLNELLSSNGLPIIDDSDAPVRPFLGAGQLYRSHYSYPAVAEAVEQQGLPLRIIAGR